MVASPTSACWHWSRRSITGTPQGGVLSPLLANIALSVLDEHADGAWQAMGASAPAIGGAPAPPATWRLVRYADDVVVMVAGTRTHAEQLRADIAAVLARMGLRLSDGKTRIVHLDEGFDFLGFRIQRQPKRGTSKHVVYTYPSKKAVAAVKATVRALTTGDTNRPLAALCHQLGLVLRGWGSYFRHGVSKATVDYLREFTWRRVVCWLRHKHPHATWRWLRRRHLPGWWPTDGAVVLFDLGKMAVTRSRYRATRIPTPWTATSSRTVA